MSQWTNARRQKPAEEANVLAYTPQLEYFIAFYDRDMGCWYTCGAYPMEITVTHWQLLPEGPRQRKASSDKRT